MYTTKKTPFTIITKAAVIVVAVIILSSLIDGLWGGSSKEGTVPKALIYNQDMTFGQFAEINAIPEKHLKEIFSLRDRQQLQQTFAALGLSPKEISHKLSQLKALAHEESSKNWFKIPLKFAVWFLILILAFILMRRNRVTRPRRLAFLGSAVLIFGVILGSDPSPMGPLKDAIALYGSKGVIFKPRVVALAIFLATVVIFNKSICGWGCQLGTLQDLLFQINGRKRGVLRVYRVPFALSNGVRIIFVGTFCALALLKGLDIIGIIDPFKIFKPTVINRWGWAFLLFLLGASLVIYRPWCQLFCPFGLLGWLGEQLAIFKIRINHKTCTNCGACVQACPSQAMNSIWRQKALRADCFACGACLRICPTRSIYLGLKEP